jgi:hypothetical protein
MKADEPSGTYLFEEKQQFPHWLLLLVLGPLAVTLVILMVQISLHKVPLHELVIGLAVIIPIFGLLTYYFVVVQLEKVVTTNGFYYRWVPVQRRYQFIEKERIARILKRRAPLLHYGYGFYLTYGWVHHVNGRQGLQVYLRSGKKLFFGATDTTGFEKAMKELIANTPKLERREY